MNQGQVKCHQTNTGGHQNPQNEVRYRNVRQVWHPNKTAVARMLLWFLSDGMFNLASPITRTSLLEMLQTTPVLDHKEKSHADYSLRLKSFRCQRIYRQFSSLVSEKS